MLTKETSDIADAFTSGVTNTRSGSGAPLQAAERRELERHLETQFRNLEQLFSQRAHVFGNRPGLADIALYAFLVSLVYLVLASLLTLPWTIYSDWWREKGYGRTSQPLGDFLGRQQISVSFFRPSVRRQGPRDFLVSEIRGNTEAIDPPLSPRKEVSRLPGVRPNGLHAIIGPCRDDELFFPIPVEISKHKVERAVRISEPSLEVRNDILPRIESHLSKLRWKLRSLSQSRNRKDKTDDMRIHNYLFARACTRC